METVLRKQLLLGAAVLPAAIAALGLSITLILVLAACPDPSGVVDVPVTAFSLDGLVTAPVKDATPNAVAIDTAQYTGTIAWQTEGGAPHSGAFGASTVYRALITLTAKPGYTFEGVAANSFTYTGATTITNIANSGVIIIIFPTTGPDEETPDQDTVITAFSLDSLVTAPVKDATPNAVAIDTAQYTGTIAWQTEGGAPHSGGAFAASTVYRALITLAAKPGYTFEGVAANKFTYTGATAVTNAANSGIVTIIFPATADPDQDTIVNTFSLDGLVTAPVKAALPNTKAINTAQYTGTIAWQTEGGAIHSGAFGASTVYRALITLTAKPGYTFEGVAANSFTYTGATAIANAANNGEVTITFPATADTEVAIGNPSVTLYMEGNPLSHNGSTTIGGTGVFTVSIAPGTYTEIIWYLNGNEQAQARGKTSIVLTKRTAMSYLVTVEATPTGGVKNTGSHAFVVQ
jgi:hypothetical protein